MAKAILKRSKLAKKRALLLVQFRNGAKNFVSVTVKSMAALSIDNRRICCRGIRFE
jgi:hypothetical protein